MCCMCLASLPLFQWVFLSASEFTCTSKNVHVTTQASWFSAWSIILLQLHNFIVSQNYFLNLQLSPFRLPDGRTILATTSCRDLQSLSRVAESSQLDLHYATALVRNNVNFNWCGYYTACCTQDRVTATEKKITVALNGTVDFTTSQNGYGVRQTLLNIMSLPVPLLLLRHAVTREIVWPQWDCGLYARVGSHSFCMTSSFWSPS